MGKKTLCIFSYMGVFYHCPTILTTMGSKKHADRSENFSEIISGSTTPSTTPDGVKCPDRVKWTLDPVPLYAIINDNKGERYETITIQPARAGHNA